MDRFKAWLLAVAPDVVGWWDSWPRFAQFLVVAPFQFAVVFGIIYGLEQLLNYLGSGPNPWPWAGYEVRVASV